MSVQPAYPYPRALLTLAALAVTSCDEHQPGRGEPGVPACDPVLVDRQCFVWRCWSVDDEGWVDWWYEWDEDDGVHHTRTCYSVATCYDAMLVAAWQGCGVDLSL
jgi:hypothetical protein